MVFITGTPENKGRVASHPRKATPSIQSSSSGRSPRPSTEPETTSKSGRFLDLVPAQPLTPAWEDYITLLTNGHDHRTLMTALHVPLGGVVREETGTPDEEQFSIVLPPYTPLNISSNMHVGNLVAGGQCLVHAPPSDDAEGPSESFCVFLFDVGCRTDYQAFWRVSTTDNFTARCGST